MFINLKNKITCTKHFQKWTIVTVSGNYEPSLEVVFM